MLYRLFKKFLRISSKFPSPPCFIKLPKTFFSLSHVFILDFFLSAHLKNKIFATPTATIEELKRCITMEIQDIPQKMLRKVFQNMMCCTDICKNLDGVYFWYMLWLLSTILDNIDLLYKFHDPDK